MSQDTSLMALAERTVEHAKRHGASEASVAVDRDRFIELEQRDGKLEKVREAASSSLSVSLYVDGRYSAHATSDLRWEAVDSFVARAVEMTRLLSPDPHRKLADPALYANRPTVDLELRDPGYGSVNSDRRRADVRDLEEAARSVEGPVISVTAGYSDSEGEGVLVHSNGFAGETSGTSFWAGASVSVQDDDGRKPSDGEWCGARFRGDLPGLEDIGLRAAKRALGRLGQKKLGSGTMTVVFENRAAGGLLRHLLGPMAGSALQQKRSFSPGQTRAGHRERASVHHGRPAPQASVRIPPLRRRRHLREAAPPDRQGEARLLPHRRLLREQAWRGAHGRRHLEPVLRARRALCRRHHRVGRQRHLRHGPARRQLRRHERRLLPRRHGPTRSRTES